MKVVGHRTYNRGKFTRPGSILLALTSIRRNLNSQPNIEWQASPFSGRVPRPRRGIGEGPELESPGSRAHPPHGRRGRLARVVATLLRTCPPPTGHLRAHGAMEILRLRACRWCWQSFVLCRACGRGHAYCSLPCRHAAAPAVFAAPDAAISRAPRAPRPPRSPAGLPRPLSRPRDASDFPHPVLLYYLEHPWDVVPRESD